MLSLFLLLISNVSHAEQPDHFIMWPFDNIYYLAERKCPSKCYKIPKDKNGKLEPVESLELKNGELVMERGKKQKHIEDLKKKEDEAKDKKLAKKKKIEEFLLEPNEQITQDELKEIVKDILRNQGHAI